MALLVPGIRSVLADLNRHHFMRLQTDCGDYTSPDIGAAPLLAATPKFKADVKILSSHLQRMMCLSAAITPIYVSQ